jgi:ABC-2 type transport system permease protein
VGERYRVADQRGMLLGYRRMLGAQLRSQTQYRTSFAVDLLLNAMMAALELIAVLAVFRVTPQLGGFPFREALVIATLTQLAFATADLCVGNLERLPFYLRTGLLDAVLLRPLPALGQLVVTDASPRRAGRVLQTGALYGLALTLAPIDWTPARAALALLAPIAGAVLYSAVFVAGSAAMFWLVDAGEVVNAFTYGGRTFASYPMSIYGTLLRQTLGYVLGLATVGYLPTLAVLGHPDPLGLPTWLQWGGLPVAATGWVGAATFAWRSGIRHYEGTGS